jgi:hypothetical protein
LAVLRVAPGRAFFAVLRLANLAVGRSATTFLAVARALALRVVALLRRAAFAAAFAFLGFRDVGMGVPSICSGAARAALAYFLRTTLCGLRLPMRPLSVPAAGSITALMRVGWPESMAWFTARLSSSGVVTLTPTPPNASMILS